MARVQRDDHRAFEILYQRHRRAVFSLALRILDDRGLAADATQEAFIGLWRNRSGYRSDRGQLKWWLLRIVRNRAIDLQRRNREMLHGEGAFELIAASETTEEQLLIKDARRELIGLLASLPPEQRDVIELAYLGGLTHAEITQRLGVPLGTIKSRTRLALQKLRVAMPDRSTQPAPIPVARRAGTVNPRARTGRRTPPAAAERRVEGLQ